MCLSVPLFSQNGHSSTKEPIALPATPQQRRQHLQTQVAKKKMSIEQYLLETDPYRCSTANPVFPVPLGLYDLDPSLAPKLRCLRGAVFDCLTNHGIKDIQLNFYNVSKPFYPNGGDVKVPTLVIYADVGDEVSTADWLPASESLHKLLSDRKFPGVCVEIQDRKRYFQPSLFPLLPEDEAVRSYEAVRKDLIEIIRENLKNTWSMMSVFKIGRDLAQAVTAIVVMVQPLANQDWWTIKEQMGKFTPLEIVFAIGSCQPIHPPVAPPQLPAFLFNVQFPQFPKLGSSIGVKRGQEGGTLGGFINLICGDVEHRGILTTAQVVEPPSSAAALVKQQADREGIRYKDYKNYKDHKDPDPELAKTNIQYPAQKDIEAARQGIDEGILDVQRQIEKLRAEAMGKKTDCIEKRECYLAELKSLIPTSESMLIPIGKVLISSGKAISNNFLLNWAFVELDKGSDKIFKNRDKNRVPFVRSEDIYTYKNAGYCSLKEGNDVLELSEVKKGHWYLKVGRTTNVTTGICHGTEVYCNNVGAKHRTRYDETNMQSTLVEVDYTEELVLLSKKSVWVSKPGVWNSRSKCSGELIDEQSDFCQAGDSGSWLVDSEQNLAGLLFGSITNLCGPWNKSGPPSGPYTNVGLVTSMAEVQKSIAAWTTPRDSNGAPNGPPGFLSL